MPVVTAPAPAPAPALALSLTATQRAELTRIAASSSLPHRQVVQAKALLWAADGVANQEIARRSQVEPDTVRRWRARFAEQGVEGVGKITKGRGRKSPLTEGTVAEVVRVTCQEKPDDTGTHWTTRSLAKRFGVVRTPSPRSGPTTTSSRPLHVALDMALEQVRAQLDER
jgi:transposase